MSVQSLVFDLGPYISYLKEFTTDGAQSESPLLALFDKLAEQETDEVRKFRVELNQEKTRRMLGLLQVQDPSEIKRLLGLYLKYSKLDGKPEKGERKMADDFVLLINEALEDLNDEADRKKGQISEQDLFRIGLLEYALSLSPDNFDIQMSLLKIYDSLGISLLFKQAHESLNMKGV